MSSLFEYVNDEFEFTLNISNNTEFRDSTAYSRMMFYFETYKWCMEHIGEGNFLLMSEYRSPGLTPEWYIHTVTEEDMLVFKLKFVNGLG